MRGALVTAIAQITPITIRDIDFTVARQIEQCPKTMMLRELVTNALEAAALAPKQRRVVEIKGKTVPECGDARKLAIWNTGPGMSSAELNHICDLAASIGKDMSLSANFGMGAKVASLPSNPLGIRYRSCKDGIVSQVILGKREGRYGKVWHPIHDPETGEHTFEEVIDVTELVRVEAEYSLDEDWTEVVLFGATRDQDTVADPYAGDPPQDKQWITTGLYHRFYRLPDGVEVYLAEGTHPRDSRRLFSPIPDRLDKFGRTETVPLVNGVKIHYLYDPPYKDGSHNVSIRGALTSSVSTCAIVFRGEMYDVRKSRKWASDAPAFGIPFGARHISVHVELPDDHPVRHEAYRRFLQFVAGDQRQVTIEDFTEIMIQNRPPWLVDIINSLAPKASSSTDELRRELQNLLNELRVRAHSPRISIDGSDPVEIGKGRGAKPTPGTGSEGDSTRQPIKPTELIYNPLGAKRSLISKNMEQAPEIFPLYDDDEIAEKEIVGKAARYFRETNVLYINMHYSAVDAAFDHLVRRYAEYEDPELVRTLAKQWAERIVMGRVGYAVVYAQAKQLLKEWTPDDVRKALEPECLSLAADGWRDAISSAYHSLSRRLGMSAARTRTSSEEDLALVQ